MTVRTLFDSQVDTLVKKVRRLVAQGGTDAQAYEQVRSQVSGELMNQGKLEVVSCAIGELDPGPGGELLQKMVLHCSESFYFADRVLSAVVVPVAVRLHSPTDNALTLAQGEQFFLNLLTLGMQNWLGSRKVVFDSRLYDGRTLWYQNAKSLKEFLLKLESGEVLPAGGPKQIEVHSGASGQWQMVYFLGVEVMPAKSVLPLSRPDAQRALLNELDSAEHALSRSRKVTANKAVSASAKCFGMWYLGEGVMEGENAIRGYHLESVVATFSALHDSVHIVYAEDFMGSQIKLLVSNGQRSEEYLWKTIGAETKDVFLATLEAAVARVLPKRRVAEMRQIDLYDYQQRSKQRGLAFWR